MISTKPVGVSRDDEGCTVLTRVLIVALRAEGFRK